jgi:hypothetical protein
VLAGTHFGGAGWRKLSAEATPAVLRINIPANRRLTTRRIDFPPRCRGIWGLAHPFERTRARRGLDAIPWPSGNRHCSGRGHTRRPSKHRDEPDTR